MEKYFAVFFLVMCGMVSSCADPPVATVRNVLDLEQGIYPDKVVIVSDAGKIYGEIFGNAFVDKLVELTENCNKEVTIMKYIEYVRSPYNNPELRSSFADSVFVFIEVRGGSSGQWGVYKAKYLMKVKHLDQDPFLVQDISLFVGDLLVDSHAGRSEELANTVFEELSKRNIL